MASRREDRESITLRLYNQKILIYGAGVIAYEIYKAVTELFHCSVDSFIVTNQEKNCMSIEQIPVRTSEYLQNQDKTVLILVAAPEVYHFEIDLLLKSLHFYNVLNIDSHTEYLIMSEYFRNKKIFRLLEDLPELDGSSSEENSDLNIYMAKSIYDKNLAANYQSPGWVIPIQVGKDLTNKSMDCLGDNIGDHISSKNKKYSELTATYYVWKNEHHRYKGICHYRRVFELSKEDIKKIYEFDVDVLLPLPFLCYDDAEKQYGRYISKEDMEIVWQTLKEFSVKEFKMARIVLHDLYLYNYNMLVAKEEVFNQYCEWLFPRLLRVEELSDQKNGERQDRYIGYIGEILTSFYFIYFGKNYCIYHGEKKWLI